MSEVIRENMYNDCKKIKMTRTYYTAKVKIWVVWAEAQCIHKRLYGYTDMLFINMRDKRNKAAVDESRVQMISETNKRS